MARYRRVAPRPRPTPPLPADLDALRKDELVALAAERGVDGSGTRADIIRRLRA